MSSSFFSYQWFLLLHKTEKWGEQAIEAKRCTLEEGFITAAMQTLLASTHTPSGRELAKQRKSSQDLLFDNYCWLDVRLKVFKVQISHYLFFIQQPTGSHPLLNRPPLVMQVLLNGVGRGWGAGWMEELNHIFAITDRCGGWTNGIISWNRQFP